MRVPLAPQAQASLGQSDWVMIPERVDDVAVLIGQMVKRGWPEVVDRPLPPHWTQRGLSWGWTAVIWLAYILMEGDHRTVSVATYLTGMQPTLSPLTAQVIEPLDCRDARWSHLLKHLRKKAYGHQIEHDVTARSLEVYAVSQAVLRCAATPVPGEHEGTADGLLQFGPSKDDPTRPQSKVLLGALAPWGMPLATDGWSGERADAGLSLPLMERIRSGVRPPGLVLVGDGKMSALDPRASLARPQDWSWSPGPLTGATAEAMEAWSTTGGMKREAGAWEQLWRTNDRGHEGLAAEGDEFERTWGAAAGEAAWRARVVGVRSPLHAPQQAAGLEQRLSQAAPPLPALPPPRGRGTRQSTDEATLVEAMDLVRPEPRGEGVLHVVWAKQGAQTTRYVGRGRGSGSREKRVIPQTRSHIPPIARQEAPIAARSQRFGWKAFVTPAGPQRLSLQAAVLGYRNAYRVERIFNRLKSRGHIAPLVVKLNEQSEGLTSLLTLGVRV